MKIRNISSRDLEVAGRVLPAGKTVEVKANEAKWLGSNPNFKRVGAQDGAAAAAPAGGGESTDAAAAAQGEEN